MNQMREVVSADPVDPEFEIATKDSVRLMDAMAGKDQNAVRAPGSILTVDNVVKIKTYVWHARSFPRDQEAIRVYLGEGDFEKGLYLQDFQKTFTMVRDHAELWDPLEQNIRNLGTELEIFAADMSSQSNLISAVIDDLIKNHAELEGLPKRYDQLVEACKKFDHEQRSAFLLNEDGQSNQRDVVEAIDTIFSSVSEISKKTLAIQYGLNCFIEEMQRNVIPEIKVRKEALDNSRMSEQVKEQKIKVETLKLEVAESSRLYRDKVRESVNSVAKGFSSGGASPIGLAVSGLAGLAMGIYYGVEAENEKARRDELQADLDEQVRQFTLMDVKQGKMQALQVKFNVLQTIALEAEAGLLNMRTVWDAITSLAVNSRTKADKTRDSISLILLASRVKEVASPWCKIKIEVTGMLGVFVDADSAYLAAEGKLV
jgi:hypothetical protein